MSPSKRILLTVAQGPRMAEPAALLTLQSFAETKANGLDARLVVLCSRVPPEYPRQVEAAGGEVLQSDVDFGDAGWKNRHLTLLRAIEGQFLEAERILTFDARDTLFLGDPFTDWPAVGRIRLSQEGGAVRDDDWNSADVAGLNGSIREGAGISLPNTAPIVNGGFACGDPTELAEFLQLRVAVDLRRGEGSDQSSLGLLHHLFGRESGWTATRMSEPWIFHGHWWKSWADRVELVDGFRPHIDGKPYAVFHQFDREDRVPGALPAAHRHFKVQR